MNEQCPYCGSNMESGYIQCRDGLVWARKKRPVASILLFTELQESSIILANCSGNLFSGAAVKAQCCRACKKIVIDYGC